MRSHPGPPGLPGMLATGAAAIVLAALALDPATTLSTAPGQLDHSHTTDTTTAAATPTPARPGTPAAAQQPSGTVSATRSGTAYRRVTRRDAHAITVTSKTAVDHAYRSGFAPTLTTPTGDTANTRTCARGATSTTYRAAFLRAVNFARRLAGLAPVRLANTLNSRAQAAALIMDANNTLSHYPPRTWACWTRPGHAAAGRSDLALGFTGAGETTAAYLTDLGRDNTAAGHRRWLLNPFAAQMGVGAADTANAVYVVGPTDNYAANPAYVGWPTRGWFPNTLEPHGRWSVSAGDARTQFGAATVHVTDNGVRIHVRQYRVENGYAQPTLVWQMPQIHPTDTYTVKVTGIRKRYTTRRFATTYTVRLFNPTR